MTRAELNSLRHPSENSRFWITLIVIVPILVAAIGFTLASRGGLLIPIVVILFFVWVMTRIVSSSFLGNSIRVSDTNFPEIASALKETQEMFQYNGQIDAYVYENGGYNALVVPLLRRKLILLNSEIISNAESDNEIRWIIARFVGSLASRHYRFFWLQAVVGSIERIMIFNLLMYPYERAVSKTGDQLGLYAINGDIESAIRATHKLMVGGALGGRIKLLGVLHQHDFINGSFFGWLARCLSPFPHLTTRVVNLIRFSGHRYPEQLRQFLSNSDSNTKSLVLQVTGLSAAVLEEKPTSLSNAE